jgi:hypothetical protein
MKGNLLYKVPKDVKIGDIIIEDNNMFEVIEIINNRGRTWEYKIYNTMDSKIFTSTIIYSKYDVLIVFEREGV